MRPCRQDLFLQPENRFCPLKLRVDMRRRTTAITIEPISQQHLTTRPAEALGHFVKEAEPINVSLSFKRMLDSIVHDLHLELPNLKVLASNFPEEVRKTYLHR